MENRRIMVESLTHGIIVLYEPITRLRIEWRKKGEKKPVPLDKLKEAIWTEGVNAMFKEGILGIAEKDSFELLKELGLEAPDAKEPEQVVVLNDAQRTRLLKSAPISEFKETFDSISYEQKQQMADFAIEKQIIDFNKCEYIKEQIGVDVIQAVKLRNDADKA